MNENRDAADIVEMPYPRWTTRKPWNPATINVEPSRSQVRRRELMDTDMMRSEMSTPTIPPANLYNISFDSLYSSMGPIILLAQCFSMFPVNSILKPDASYLRFKWDSLKVLYSAITLLGVFMMTIFNALRIYTTGVNSRKMTTFVFYVTTLVTGVLFLRLAEQWPRLALTWEKLERKFIPRFQRVSKTPLAIRFKIVTIVVILFALVEHGAAVLSAYISALECAAQRNDSDIMGIYYQLEFPQVFTWISYSPWKGILVDIINILSTFSWNFVDLFLILISIALANQFKQLNRRLGAVKNKHHFVVKAVPEWWWAEARMDYNNLATLTRKVDSHISGIVLLSFATNLYFICIQLLYSFNPIRDSIQKIYFCFSFGFLLARTTAVSLYAASVHDESLLPAPILYSISASRYSKEVSRFLMQVTTDNISLTGMKFFSVTRSLVLTIAGTIVTYELVLVQFNAVQQVDHSNITDACEVR